MSESGLKHSGKQESDSFYRYKRPRIDVKKRPLKELSMSNNSLDLRIVYPKTLYVVGVYDELNNAEVGTPSSPDPEEVRKPRAVRPHSGSRGQGKQLQ
jgi:hypothetical protein